MQTIFQGALDPYTTIASPFLGALNAKVLQVCPAKTGAIYTGVLQAVIVAGIVAGVVLAALANPGVTGWGALGVILFGGLVGGSVATLISPLIGKKLVNYLGYELEWKAAGALWAAYTIELAVIGAFFFPF